MFKNLFLFFFAFSLFTFSAKASANNDNCRGIKINTINTISELNTKKEDLEPIRDKLENEMRNKPSTKTPDYEALNTNKQKCEGLIEEINTKINKISGACEAGIKEMREAKSAFATACGEFSTGRIKCDEAISACSKCPDESESGGYDCVKARGQSQCPALAGEELEEAKQRIDDLERETEDIERDIQDGERDMADQENDLREVLTELEEDFSQTVRDFEREAEEQKADLEDQLRKSQSEIKSALSESLAKAQAQIDESLKIAHSFENAIFKANMEYRAERRKIIMECEVQAQGRLAQYRQKRRSAIQTGSLRASLSSLLRRGRASFASKDKRLAKQYKAQCLSNRKADFKEAQKLYKHKLRLIEQQKEQYQEKLAQLKRQFTGLSQQAGQQENSLIQSYAANMKKIIDNHQKEHKLALEKYLKAKKSLLAQTNKIAVAQRQLFAKKRDLGLKQTELLREAEMKSYLQSKGVTSEGGGGSAYANALSAFHAYDDSVSAARASCFCGESNEDFKTECGAITRQGEKLEEQGLVKEGSSLGQR